MTDASMKKTRVAILGATGYGGGELVRTLLFHSAVEVVYATSRSKAGVPVHEVHKNLYGCTELCFSSPSEEDIAANVDLVIGALPHGASAEVLAPFVKRGMRVVDLSGDYRLRDLDAYRKWYKREHPHPELISTAVYGCPEFNRDKIAGAQLVASPGCFATSMNLALLPAASKGWLKGTAAVVAMTGSSGSGAEPKLGTHHPLRARTLRPYKVLSHQHVPEVLQTMKEAGASELEGLSFTPVSAPLVRGILTIIECELAEGVSADEVVATYEAYYANHPFAHVLSDREPECGAIAATNHAHLRARVSPQGRLHVICAIDNLVKGGAGQAMQAMNLMLGLPETCGLNMPGTWP